LAIRGIRRSQTRHICVEEWGGFFQTLFKGVSSNEGVQLFLMLGDREGLKKLSNWFEVLQKMSTENHT